MTAPTYPSSQDVSAGQPTGYQQYNRLRADALRLGASQNDAVALGRFIGHYISGIRLTYLANNRLRIQYDPRFPPTIMINGYMCQTDHNVDLAANSFSGGMATWYVFANRTQGSSEFTLSVNTSATEGPDQRLLGVCEWNGSAIEQTSVLTYQADSPGCKMTVITLQAFIQYTTNAGYGGSTCCHHLLDFSRLKPGAKSAYLAVNLIASSATAYARLYDITDSITLVEVSTSANDTSNITRSGDLLNSLPGKEVLTHFDIRTSGSRADCYWAALIFEY
jgi:hypothetical protein